MNKWLLIIPILLTGCGIDLTKPKEHENDIDQLLDKRSTYLRLIENHQGKAGFVEARDCDSLLFSALSAFGGAKVNIKKAYKDGRWFRNPYHDCYPENSKSSISRDMLLGLMIWAYAEDEKDILKDLWSYGKKHDWKYGDGPATRTVMTPQMVKTLSLMVNKTYHLNQNLESWNAGPGYTAHIAVLHIMLRAMINGEINDKMSKALKRYRNSNDENAFFQFMYHYFEDGDQSETVDILMDTSYFPEDRLPQNKDRCEPWLWQREYGPSYLPCKGKGEHSGGDFLFVVKLLELSKSIDD